ncbi:uncharacterized protein FSUBG_6012 [Fusarium subglutinans]|uniref:Uncharacterized protein n=1 Tax=Gibberella subglutinans TaxID=42677 RepID=A0A8H5Q085_GIBSU|nr:uncharacterized protein FSUBG_6012 [Fusarium subglutinans]KAF5606405.1 hypothetical protein FSUBG_6012 [Fusarium subglutinans]
MDQLQSAKSALQQTLAEIEAAIASLSTAPADDRMLQKRSEHLASSESSDEISDDQSQPRPSKASVQDDGGKDWTEYGLDARFQQDKWVRPKPPGRSCFSSELIQWAAVAELDDEGVEYPILTLRHHNASKCIAGEPCGTGHWELIHDRVATEVEGCLDLQLLCMRTEHVERQMTSCPSENFYDYKDSITNLPCKLFNELLPDFSSVTRAGYEVIIFRLVERFKDEDIKPWVGEGVWLDSHGRVLRDMDDPDWA